MHGICTVGKKYTSDLCKPTKLLQCVAVCCGVMQCVVVQMNVNLHNSVCCSVLQCVAVCCSVWQCAAVCCSVLQCIAVCCKMMLPH